MQTVSIAHCAKSLDFRPTRQWPEALPAFAWRGQLICAFSREQGEALDLFEVQRATLIGALKATHPELGLAELARLSAALEQTWPETFQEIRNGLFQEYSLRWSERLAQTLSLLKDTPPRFQDWVDEKHAGPRDLSVLLALPRPLEFYPFLEAMTQLELSRNDGVRALELGAELFLMGRPLNDILPSTDRGPAYLRQLEKWRRPNSLAGDDLWRETVRQWPWPSQVQGKWQRFGDQAGLEINIRSTSPEDLHKKLERLLSIGNTWHDRNDPSTNQ